MDKLSVSVPAKYYSSLVQVLSRAENLRLDVRGGPALPALEDAPLSIDIEAESFVAVVEALKGWLDTQRNPDCDLRLFAGRHMVPMRILCRKCQDGEQADLRAPVRVCDPPTSRREWCPLAFLLPLAAEDAPPPPARRKRTKQ
ncbi:MAG: hypothetical protein HY684_06220 [Chloroflexi bacterium]|nr:hypothetical protein [Chloroflexota bacterium]